MAYEVRGNEVEAKRRGDENRGQLRQQRLPMTIQKPKRGFSEPADLEPRYETEQST